MSIKLGKFEKSIYNAKELAIKNMDKMFLNARRMWDNLSYKIINDYYEL